MAILLFFLLLFIFVITSRKASFFQWLLLFILIDPTGHINRYFSKTYSWGIEQSDIVFILIVLSFFIVGNFHLHDFFKDRVSSGIFKILFTFFLYRIIIYGYIVPPVSGINEYFRYFIVRERTPIFSFLFIIPAYLIARQNLQTYFRLIVIFGTFGVVFFLVSVLTGVEIIPFSTMQRYQTGGVLRNFMYSYNSTITLASIAIVVYISKIEVKYKKLLYIGGIFSVIAIMISLTKGLYLGLISVILFSAFFTVRALKISISKGIQQAVIFGLVALLLLNILLPSYLGFSKRLVNELYTLGKTGTYGEGKTEGRIDVVIPAQLFMIKERPIFGAGMSGYQVNNLSKEFDPTAYDSTDVSITGTVMQYGILGMLIYYFFYFRFYLEGKKLYTLIRKTDRKILVEKYKYEFIISISIISLFIGGLIQVQTISGELTGGIVFYINVGILLACLDRVKEKILIERDNSKVVTGLEQQEINI